MTTQLRPLSDVDRAGRAALGRELGVADALRFLGQFNTGRGDYTAERKAFLGDETLEELYEQAQAIRRDRKASAQHQP